MVPFSPEDTIAVDQCLSFSLCSRMVNTARFCWFTEIIYLKLSEAMSAALLSRSDHACTKDFGTFLTPSAASLCL